MGIALFRTDIGDEAVEAAADTLRSGWLGHGERVEEFERAFAELVGAEHCVAVASGTAALHLALHVLDLAPDAEVVTTPLTWIAAHHAILYERKRPVLADIDPATGNIDPASIEARLSPRTGAIAVLHYGGYPCDLDEVRAVAEHAGVPLIEDCAHAVGAAYKGKPIGTGSALHCFSFGPVKNLTGGGGGAITTSDPACVERLRALRSLGVGSVASWMRRSGSPFRSSYELGEIGFRYEMGELNGAIGLAQLRRFERDNERREAIARAYCDGLSGVPGLELPPESDDRVRAWHLFPVLVERRDDLARRLAEGGVEVGVHYPPNPLVENGALPAMERFSARTLSLPMHTGLGDGDVEAVVDLIRAGW